MKKIFLILPIVLCSCVSSLFGSSETIKNPDCQRVRRFQIIQSFDNGALASDCSSRILKTCFGQLVFIPKEHLEDGYFDGQYVNVEKKYCPTYEGTYKYINRQNISKTIPRIKIIDMYIPNPEYIEQIENSKKD